MGISEYTWGVNFDVSTHPKLLVWEWFCLLSGDFFLYCEVTISVWALIPKCLCGSGFAILGGFILWSINFDVSTHPKVSVGVVLPSEGDLYCEVSVLMWALIPKCLCGSGFAFGGGFILWGIIFDVSTHPKVFVWEWFCLRRGIYTVRYQFWCEHSSQS